MQVRVGRRCVDDQAFEWARVGAYAYEDALERKGMCVYMQTGVRGLRV